MKREKLETKEEEKKKGKKLSSKKEIGFCKEYRHIKTEFIVVARKISLISSSK
jgi:hypothetical protein